MATASVSPNYPVDFRSTFDISNIFLGTVTIASSTTIRVMYDATNYDEFTGTGFIYDSATGDLIGGTLTGIRGVRDGVAAYSVTGFSMPALTFLAYANSGDTQGALVDIFDGNDSLKGSNFNDYIIGYDGNDTINAGPGDDEMEGGGGNDLYIADSVNDFVYEDAGGGNDTVQSSSDYILDPNVENIVLTGSATIGTVANELDNVIVGNVAVNFIDGDAGNDTITAGSGNDLIFGWTGNDSIDGGAGNDILLGEEGIDMLRGGSGKDLYVYNPSLDGPDVVITGEKGLDFAILDDSDGASLLQFYDWDFDREGNDLLITAYVDEADADNGFDAAEALRIKDQYAGAGIAFFDVNLGELNSFYTAFSDFTRVYTPGGLTGKNQGDDAELIVGTDSADKISGNGGHTDWLFAEGGNDTVTSGGQSGHSGWLYGGAGADSLQGGAGNDNLRGDEGNDTLNGGAENPNLETLFLGDRADYRGSADGVTVDLTKQGAAQFISADQGTDTLIEIENVRGSNLNDVITGDAGRNWLSGNSGDDSLNGNAGADVLEGRDGNDTVGGSAGDDELYGGDGDDVLQGGDGFDFMEGSAGNDTLDGGSLEGQDEITYEFDSGAIFANLSASPIVVGGDTVAAGTVRNIFGDTDTVINIAGVRGGVFSDYLQGNDGYNYFEGGAGNDVMIGGGGSDGLDFFTASQGVNVDLNKQDQFQAFGAGLGADSISGFEEVYGSFFNDILTGDGNDNFLIGRDGFDAIAGNAGNDTIQGGFGADYLDGGLGIDLLDLRWADSGVAVDLGKQGAVQVVAKGDGLDIFTGFEDVRGSGFNDKLTGDGIANALFGLGGNDTFTGNAGNDTLDGGAGGDAMSGGADDDTYEVDDLKDKVIEAVNSGVDLVRSTVTHVLSVNVENLELVGDGDSNGSGNASKNKLTGNDGDNVLDGKTEADIMAGGKGNDTYILDVAGDLVTEAADGGVDTVKSSILIGTFDNVENYIFTGSKAVDFTGTDADNLIIGTGLNDGLIGGLGNDTLRGGVGIDTLKGDDGSDVYGIDNVKDKIEDSGGAKDRVESSITFSLETLVGIGIEDLTLIGAGAINGTGNDLANTIVGNAGANKLDGKGGVDTMIGNAGNDIYMVDDTGELVTELDKGGTDLVISTQDYTLSAQVENLTLMGAAVLAVGNALVNSLIGNAVNNLLDGKEGADKMAGGKGDDIYVVDDKGDVVTEAAGAGEDLVRSSISYVLGANLEDLELLGDGNVDGTGNAAKNELTGNAGDNLLDGKAEADVMTGGKGDDTYIVDVLGDVVTEAADGGNDTVKSSVATGTIDNVENYIFTGSKAVDFTGTDADNLIIGTATNDKLTGGLGNDTLIGGVGMDTLSGGDEDDSYGVDNVKDSIIDTIGNDTVLSSITYSLTNPLLENLTLIGTGAIGGTGSVHDNVIIGNAGANALSGGDGNDTIDGGLGADKMTGGAGSDVFLRHSVAEAKDTITDFATGVGGDALDISDMLIGFDVGEESAFVQLVTSATATTVKVDVDGSANGAKYVDVVVLTGVTTATLQSLLDDGNLVLSA